MFLRRMMKCPLTIVLRFIKHRDLTIQLRALDLAHVDDCEILCVGYGSEEDFSKARDKAESMLGRLENVRFEHVEGDHAVARTRAIYTASGDYLLFPNVFYIYEWDKVIEAVSSDKSICDAIVLRSQNLKRADVASELDTNEGAIVKFGSTEKNYFQAFGCAIAYTAISNFFARKNADFPYCKTCHDNAFMVKVGIACDCFQITDNLHNAVSNNNRDESNPKAETRYSIKSIIDSINLLFEIRNIVQKENSAPLLDSFQRLFASKIRTYLMQNLDYNYRKAILDILRADENTIAFFLEGDCPKWNKTARRNFEFVKWAIRTYVKNNKSMSYDFDQTEAVITSSNQNPKVSIVVPVYNTEGFIGETLDSVLNQTYSDFEIVCIDDGSTDKGLNILRAYAQKDKRISVYTQPNMGLSIARNSGIRLSKGEYIYFLDSDDLLEPEFLETCMNAIDGMNLDVVCFGAKTFFDSEELAEEHSNFEDTYIKRFSYDKVMSGPELIYDLKRNNEYNVNAWLYIIKKSLITDNALCFYPGILHEDNLFTFKLMNCAERVYQINKALYLRRIRPDSIMTREKTFENSYGYFVTAKSFLTKDFKYDPQYGQTVNDLSISLACSSINTSRYNLLEAKRGQEGGAYALDDCDLRLFRTLILSEVNTMRKLDAAKKTKPTPKPVKKERDNLSEQTRQNPETHSAIRGLKARLSNSKKRRKKSVQRSQ